MQYKKASFFTGLLVVVCMAFFGCYVYAQRAHFALVMQPVAKNVEETVYENHPPVVQPMEEHAQQAQNEAEENVMEEEEDGLRTGVMIDCARRYCTVDELKNYIDFVAQEDDAFVHVHFTDNQNVGIACAFLDQVANDDNRNEDGSYTNPHTKKKFLSKQQVRDVWDYARENGVDFVPEIDLPAHAGGFLRLARHKHGNAYVQSVAANVAEGEIDIASEDGMMFVHALYDEYADFFAGNTFFHIGCDELFSASNAEKLAYVQDVVPFLQQKGFRVQMWNDFFTKKNYTDMPQDVEVTYWSYDGDTEDDEERAQRRRIRASLPELQSQGFTLLNYNSYYLYFIPSQENCNAEDAGEMRSDIMWRWNIRQWDGEYGKKAPDASGIAGAAVVVWREDAYGVSGRTILYYTGQFYRAMADNVLGE